MPGSQGKERSRQLAANGIDALAVTLKRFHAQAHSCWTYATSTRIVCIMRPPSRAAPPCIHGVVIASVECERETEVANDVLRCN